jgi:hypothetical protein
VQEERAVQPRTSVEEPPAPPPGPASASPPRRSIRAAVEESIERVTGDHPGVPALEALALGLATMIDAGVDERAVPAFVKELRATLADLTRQEAVDDDDESLGVSAPVVVPAQG